MQFKQSRLRCLHFLGRTVWILTTPNFLARVELRPNRTKGDSGLNLPLYKELYPSPPLLRHVVKFNPHTYLRYVCLAPQNKALRVHASNKLKALWGKCEFYKAHNPCPRFLYMLIIRYQNCICREEKFFDVKAVYSKEKAHDVQFEISTGVLARCTKLSWSVNLMDASLMTSRKTTSFLQIVLFKFW